MCMHSCTIAGDREINYVMAWDALSTAVCTLLTCGILTYIVFDEPFHWFSNLFGLIGDVIVIKPGEEELETVRIEMYMVSLYTTLLGLFAFPWVLFAIPAVGPMIHQMRPTGFDEAGGLKIEMTLQQMKRKQKRLMHAGLLSVEEAELLYAHVEDLPFPGLTDRARSAARDALDRGTATIHLHMIHPHMHVMQVLVPSAELLHRLHASFTQPTWKRRWRKTPTSLSEQNERPREAEKDERTSKRKEISYAIS